LASPPEKRDGFEGRMRQFDDQFEIAKLNKGKRTGVPFPPAILLELFCVGG
jgi:hypothetical protein